MAKSADKTDTPPTWNQRAAEIYDKDYGGPVDKHLLIFETAGEMKAVKLKLLLVRCYEILRHASEHVDNAALIPNGFLEQIAAEIF